MIKYLLAFFGLLLFGSIGDIPVMFLGVRGELSLYFVFIGGFLIALLSDIFWYSIGRKIGIERFEKIKFFRQKPHRMRFVGKSLDKYGMIILYISKFVYAFGIPTQIVAGAHHYPIKKMLLANVLGAISTLTVLYTLARLFASELVVNDFVKSVNLAFLMFFIFIILLHIVVSKPLRKILSRES